MKRRKKTIRSLAAILLALVLVDSTHAEQLKSNHASRRNNGSATILSGKVLLYHIFVSDAASNFTDDEKAEVGKRIEAALEFLAREGRKYAIRLQVIEETARDVTTEKPIPTDMFADPLWTERAIAASGAVGANELVARLKKRHQVDHVLIALHVDKAALSNNLSYYDHIDRTYAAERIICYTRYPDGRPTAAASYAHEILHNFGAGELYFPFDRNEGRKNIARRLFPDDIMFRVDYDMARLTIGSYTAYRIGWLDDLEAEHTVFQDPDK